MVLKYPYETENPPRVYVCVTYPLHNTQDAALAVTAAL